MAFFSIKSELRKDYIFFKKFLIFYLISSQIFISSKVQIFPDHFSKEDPVFTHSEAKTITSQEFYYDLGYFTQKTEKYRSPKYGINYRPVQCQKMLEADPELEYKFDDTIFFGPTNGINDPTSTLDKNNFFDDTKLFRNTIRGKNFSCPSPVRAFHSNDFEIYLNIPMISETTQNIDIFLYSEDGQFNETIGSVQLIGYKYNMVNITIIPNEIETNKTEMKFMLGNEISTITIFGDPELQMQFVSNNDNNIILSNYRVTINDTKTLTGEKYN